MAGFKQPGVAGIEEAAPGDGGTLSCSLAATQGVVGIYADVHLGAAPSIQRLQLDELVVTLQQTDDRFVLEQVAVALLGPRCFSLGVIVGASVQIRGIAIDGVSLAKTLVLADLHDIATQKAWWRFVNPEVGARVLLANIAGDSVAYRSGQAAKEREELISEISNLLTGSDGLLAPTGADTGRDYKRNWAEFIRYRSDGTLEGQYNAGILFGRVLASVVNTGSSIHGASALGSQLVTRLPLLSKYARQSYARSHASSEPQTKQQAGREKLTSTPHVASYDLIEPPAAAPHRPSKNATGNVADRAGKLTAGEKQSEAKRKEDERFGEGVDKQTAFRKLGGKDENRSLGKFVKVLMDEGIADSYDEIIAKVGEPGGQTYQAVRHDLKEKYWDELVERCTKLKHLQKTAKYKEVYEKVLKATGNPKLARRQARRAAGISELQRLSRQLNPADRGSMGERVYHKLFHRYGALEQVTVTREDLAKAKGLTPEEIKKIRVFDRLEGSTAKEIKNVKTALGDRERKQIHDMLAMRGYPITLPNGKRSEEVKTVSVVFIDPEGGAANARLAYNYLTDQSGSKESLVFEFHTYNGEVLKFPPQDKAILLESSFREKLGLPPAKT